MLEKIRDILNCHRGQNNPITSAQMAAALGIAEDDTHAKTRALIFKCAKKYKLPLAADSRGYFLITTQSEYEKYVKNLNARTAGIEARKKIITENFKGEQ